MSQTGSLIFLPRGAICPSDTHSWSTVIWFLSLNYTPCHFVILRLKLGMTGWPQHNTAGATGGQLFEFLLKDHFVARIILDHSEVFKAFNKADGYWISVKKTLLPEKAKHFCHVRQRISDLKRSYEPSWFPWELVEFSRLVVSFAKY